VQDCLLHVANVLGNVNTLWARFHTVEDGAAAPHASVFVENFQAFVVAVVAGVEQEPARLHDGRWTHVLVVGPEGRATGGADGTHDRGNVPRCPDYIIQPNSRPHSRMDLNK
jgi:hypothetical protein